MTTKELMVGDYITFSDVQNDSNCPKLKVVIIDKEDVYVSIDGDPVVDLLDPKDLAGIPLTSEILEKNGFVYNDLPFVQAWEQFGLALYSGGNGYRIGCGNNVALIVDSVHQLQHALRICGIEKEIEL